MTSTDPQTIGGLVPPEPAPSTTAGQVAPDDVDAVERGLVPPGQVAPDDVDAVERGLVPEHEAPDVSETVVPPSEERLRHLRLGRYGRHVLLHATPCGGASEAWVPEHTEDAKLAGTQTAVRRLRAAGLVTTEWVVVRWTEQAELRGYGPILLNCSSIRLGSRLTALGEAVLTVVGDRLRDGRPVRWPRVLPAILAALKINDGPHTATRSTTP